MSDLTINDIRDDHSKIKLYIAELEEQIKKSKLHWDNYEYNIDKKFVQSLIDEHYNEIAHHLYQIKHHLDQIDSHRRILKESSSLCRKVQDGTHSESNYICDGHIRPEEEKARLKNRRVQRSTSLKYVHQWEKMLDEQKDANLVDSIKYRSRSITDMNSNIECRRTAEHVDVPKILVKNRILQFEGIKKSKRISSTIETFLDYSSEIPRRIKSYPISEESETSDVENCISCLKKQAEDLSDENNQIKTQEGKCKIDEQLDEDKRLTNLVTDKDGDKKNLDLCADKIYSSTLQENLDNNNVENTVETKCEVHSKLPPRIVEIHYKQNTLPTSTEQNHPAITL